jgi:putative hydrolase of the HAD superfamily
MGMRKSRGPEMIITNGRQSLIFDADDTLWENNIYFEEAFDRFCDYLDHSSLTPDQVRAVLDEIEMANAQIHGYGSKNFGRNLQICLQHLAERHVGETDLRTVEEFAYAILDKPIELIEGVEETVAKLAEQHTLTIFTKGDKDEQQIKVDRSGLGKYFRHTAIVKEKNRESYLHLAEDLSFDHQHTWMIGNSPKSDINPALAAGLNAVYVPHPRTWSLEKEEVPESHPRLLRVGRISELLNVFAS